MDAAERCLPQALSLAHRIPVPSLASRLARRGRDGGSPWALLPRLLLDVYGPSVCRWVDEPRLGRRNITICPGGESHAKRRLDEQGRRRVPGCLGCDQLGLGDLNRSLTSRPT